MVGNAERLQYAVLACVCAVPIIGAFLVSPGLFIIDELIYLHAVDAMASERSFLVDNGFSQFGSPDLNLLFLIDGPNGLTPQYPPGIALFGAPLYSVFGTQGLILLNALAAAGVAVLTWTIAKRLYGSAAIANISALLLTFGTFHLEYAWGIWPHATNAFCVLLAFYLALRAMDALERSTVLRFAILSGLAVGVGMLFRADAVLILPIVGACVLLTARRTFLTLAGGVLGLLPVAALAGAINAFKFGTYNPLSYGRGGEGGGADVTSHMGAGLVILAAFAGLLLVRRLRWTPWRIKLGIAGTVLFVGVLAVLPQTEDLIRALGRGFLALFVDSRTIVDGRPGVEFTDDGWHLFWGIAKKALFQSLPWLAVLAVLLVRPWRPDHTRPNVLLLLFVFIWSLPFVVLSWHGGLGSNMRYLIPAVVPLVILASTVIHEMAAKTAKPLLLGFIGVAFSVALGLRLYDAEYGQTDGFTQQALTLYVFCALLVIVLVASVLPRAKTALRAPTFLAVSFAIGVAFFGSVLVDNSYAQQLRSVTATISETISGVEGPLLIHGAPKLFAFAASRPDVVLGVAGLANIDVDLALFEQAISAGYRAFVPLETAERVTGSTDLQFVSLAFSPNGTWVELVAETTEQD